MTYSPTAHERLMLAELIRMEAVGVQTCKVVAPILGADDLQTQAKTCVQTGQMHLRTLIDFCAAHGLEGGLA